MAVCSENEHDDLLSYTKEWINKVDRGGLFPINEKSFIFFLTIEKQVQVLLPQHMTASTSTSSREIF